VSSTTLTRTDLRGFDKQATDLILKAIEAGCTGRVSSKGHAILRNRTGQTASVPRDLSKPNRTGANTTAAVSRLITATRSDPATDRTVEDDRSCPDCGEAFAGPMALMNHTKRAHGREATTADGHTIGQIATFNHVSTGLVYSRLRAAGLRTGWGCYDLSKKAIEQIGLRMPAEWDRADHVIEPGTGAEPEVGATAPETPVAPVTDIASKESVEPTEPDTGSAAASGPDTDRPADPVGVLTQIRSLLGPDPRVGELEARIGELEQHLAAETRRADEAETRLSLINDALSA
jgi:hypothetical protein